jgi:hypothetical protein
MLVVCVRDHTRENSERARFPLIVVTPLVNRLYLDLHSLEVKVAVEPLTQGTYDAPPPCMHPLRYYRAALINLPIIAHVQRPYVFWRAGRQPLYDIQEATTESLVQDGGRPGLSILPLK